MDFGFVNPALQFIAKLINTVRDNFTGYYTNNSLTKVDKLLRVEPLVIVSKDCANLPYLPDVMQSCLSVFSAYWLRTVNILSNVQSCKTIRTLDRLNPDRDSTGFLMEEAVSREAIATERLNFSLPIPRMANVNLRPATEAKENVQTINEMTNLSVGKLFDVTMGQREEQGQNDKGQPITRQVDVTVPVAIRLMASLVPNVSIISMLSMFSDDISMTERYHAWRAGRIEFINDLIFCRDLAREHKKALLSDKTGVLSEVNRRAANAKKFGLITKNPSLVASSNVYIITEDIAREVESKLGGKLSNPRVRERVFEGTYAMILVVIDREAERITFHIADSAQSSSLSVRDIKVAGKGKSDDVSDLLKAMINQQPLF